MALLETKLTKLYLFDPMSEISVECPPEFRKENGDVSWDLREATRLLINTVVEATGASVHQVMFSNEPYQIIMREETVVEDTEND